MMTESQVSTANILRYGNADDPVRALWPHKFSFVSSDVGDSLVLCGNVKRTGLGRTAMDG
jgi:hypothetical protein